MINQTVEYALRAVATLSEAPETVRTSQQLAEATEVPATYLAKVLKDLTRAGILVSQRGLGGGYRLARSPRELTPLDVVNAVGPFPRITACPLGRSHPGGGLCALHRLLDDATARIEEAFGAVSIADLVARRGTPSGLCDARTPLSVSADGDGGE